MTRRVRPVVFTYAHDAGGASIIAAYMKHHKRTYRFVAFACGPAARIYHRLGITIAHREPEMESARLAMIAKFEEKPPAFFLCGTGGPPRLEVEMILLCKKLGIRSCAFLDHWVNYRERFDYPDPRWKDKLPDEIWAGDAESLRRAEHFFERYTRVRYVPNPYLREIRRSYRALPKKKADTILFISEPAVASKNRSLRIGERELLQITLQHLDRYWPDVKVAVRLHPSEPRDKYHGRLQPFAGRSYRIVQPSQNLLKNLHFAFLVVGLESMALVIADRCDKTILRFPPYYPRKTDAPMPGEAVNTRHEFVQRLDYYVRKHFKRS